MVESMLIANNCETSGIPVIEVNCEQHRAMLLVMTLNTVLPKFFDSRL